MLLRACCSLVLGAALLAGCAKDRATEQAVDQVTSKQAKLDQEKDKLERSRVELLGHISQVAKAASDLEATRGKFEAGRDERTAVLGARAAVMSTEAMVIGVLAQAVPLTRAGQVQLTGRVQVLNVKLAQAAHAIEALGRSDAMHYDELQDAASGALDQAQDARRDAWHALDTAPRQRASS